MHSEPSSTRHYHRENNLRNNLRLEIVMDAVKTLLREASDPL